MTSPLHLAVLFKPIKSTLTQPYLLFSPPSNTFLHLPCTSACPTPPRANAGHPNCGQLTTFWWVHFATARLALASMGQVLGTRPPLRAARPALANCGRIQPLPIPPPGSLGSAQAVVRQQRVVLLGWSFFAGSRNSPSPPISQLPAPPDPTLSSSQNTQTLSCYLKIKQTLTPAFTTSICISSNHPCPEFTFKQPLKTNYSRNNSPSSTWRKDGDAPSYRASRVLESGCETSSQP